MPKRIVDGEGVWRSKKMGEVEPVWARAEYANLIPLALANGVFECDPYLIWCEVYSFNRPDVKTSDVIKILNAFERVGLLFRYQYQAKRWGYWIGIEKPGRLPGESRRGKHEKIGPEPPIKDLHAFLESFGIQKLLGLGFGLGVGVGVGVESKTPPTAADDSLVFQGQLLQITRKQHMGLCSVYQSLNVTAHYAEADLWLVTHPERQRTDQFSFMRSWLARERRGNGDSSDSKSPAALVGAGPSLPAGVQINPKVIERERIRREKEAEAAKK